MKSLTTGQLRDPNIALRARNAARTSSIFITIFAVTLILYLYLAFTERAWQFYALTEVTAITLVLSLLALRYSWQKRIEIAAFLMIAAVVLTVVVVVTLIAGLGLVLGLGSLVGIFMIATLTLLPPNFTRANFIGISTSVAVILFDSYASFDRLEARLLTLYVPIVALIGLGTFAYYISREFANYPLRTKLVLFFILVVVGSVGAVAGVTNFLVRNAITQQVGRSQQDLAERLAFETGKELEANVDSLRALATQFEEATASSSDAYVGDKDAILTQIITLDDQWRGADDTDQLIGRVIHNEIADELREYQEKFPSHVELFLTDKYGANIAATNRTSDYYQADEDWWKIAYSLGRGRVYIGQPAFDESSQTFSVIIAIPLSHEGKVAGILRSTLDATAILENLVQGTSSSVAGIDLRFANNTLLNGEQIAQEDLSGLSNVMDGFGQITYQGRPSLVSQQRVFSSANSPTQGAVSELAWSIIVYQNLEDALRPVQQQTRVITLIAIVLMILVGLLGFYASQRLAAPILTLTDFTQKVSEGDLSIRAQISTQDEIGALANSFNRMTSQLQDILSGLERRVAERTADLELARLVSERRAQELQAISEISRTISTEQRLEILLPLVTRLVSERFDFYHTGIFFVDDTRQFAVLQASNSEGGKRMLGRGHRLEAGIGMVGSVVQTGKPRIALDVGSDAVFFDNPDLPQTRSEMALPLNFRGETIGVLDVQSIKPGAFTPPDANTLGILADQIAIAIENARLFGQMHQAREEAETLYNQFLRTEWKTFLQQDSKIGYRHTISGGQALQRPVHNEEILRALQEGQVVVLDGNTDNVKPSIAIPVKLRGQTIGILNITSSKSRKWNPDEIGLAQAISDRLALALDNARLLQESQRRAAKEAKIGEVTAKIGASINMRNVLQTAVEELGRALPGAEVVIQFEGDGK